MRIFNKVVLDDVVQQQEELFTLPAYNAMLGAAERILLQIRAGQALGNTPVTLTVKAYHSGNGVDWFLLGTLGSAQTLTVNGLDSFVRYLDGSLGPTLGLVRFGITVAPSSGNGSAKVKVIATGHAEAQYAA